MSIRSSAPARWRRRVAAPLALLTAVAGGAAVHSIAGAAGPTTLTGSSFEIEGNTFVDATNGSDWDRPPLVGTSTTSRSQVFTKADLDSGGGDDSFTQGTKEDTAVPVQEFGSIPPNKSDLKEFGYTLEETASGAKFLHLFWTRVQDPSGTTNMDFEFNRNACLTPSDDGCSANGVTPTRADGDLLITYDLARGGTQATISLRTWSAAAGKWGSVTPLNASEATGSINTETITAGFNGATYSPRTFGEAAINLNRVITGTTGCTSFGGAYLKSRSSDSFTAALKDFIAPIGVDITNCGSIKILKTDGANPLAGATFKLYVDAAPVGGTRGDEDQVAANVDPNTCTTTIKTVGSTTEASCTLSNVGFGSYWVVEETAPAGYKKADPQAVTISAASSTATLTFVDVRKQASLKLVKRDDASPANPLAGVRFDVYPAGTGGAFDASAASVANCSTVIDPNVSPARNGDCTVTGLLTDTTYWVVETSYPPGYQPDITAPTTTCTIAGTDYACQSVSVASGETNNDPSTVTMTFVNKRQYKVLVFVCQAWDDQLAAGKVALGDRGATSVPALPASANSATSTPTGVDETALCQTTGGATFAPRTAGSYPAAVGIG